SGMASRTMLGFFVGFPLAGESGAAFLDIAVEEFQGINGYVAGKLGAAVLLLIAGSGDAGGPGPLAHRHVAQGGTRHRGDLFRELAVALVALAGKLKLA